MQGILSTLPLGDLMFAETLTWQAVAVLLILISAGVCLVAILAAKAFKAWKEALR